MHDLRATDGHDCSVGSTDLLSNVQIEYLQLADGRYYESVMDSNYMLVAHGNYGVTSKITPSLAGPPLCVAP